MFAVDAVRLNETGSEMEECRRQMQDCMNRIQNLVAGLDKSWQGKAELAYAEKILYVKSHYRVLDGFFRECAKEIQDFAAACQEFEESIEDRMRFV